MKDQLKAFFADSKNRDIKTPTYLFFENQMRRNISLFKEFQENDIKLFYALKANNFPPLVANLAKSGIGFDVASMQEIDHALSLGATPEKITFSAPSKKVEDIIYANRKGVTYYSFDSEQEVNKIIANTNNPILFARIAVDSKNAAFNLSSKFGMTEKYFIYLIKKAVTKKWPIKGITFHVGSQNVSLNSWKDALNFVEKLIGIAEKCGLNIEYVNIGGGLPAPYRSGIKPTEFYIQNIISFCKDFLKKRPKIKIFAEPGRAFVASTMALLTRVIDLKPYKHPPIAIVDTGVFNGIIEPIENFEYPIFLEYFGNRKTTSFKIGGFSCEGFDIIKKSVKLPKDLQIGEIIPIMYTGAYTFVYHDFHMVPYPEILVNKQRL